jgi:excisionase family DNA binding protein
MTVTTDAAAKRLGVSQRQVQSLSASGDLAARRTAGDARLVNAPALNALARARPSRGRPWTRTAQLRVTE